MPFLTNATWPAGLLTIFEICRRELQPLESRYYGPYNKLLTYCFDPNSFEYFVAPQNPPSASSSRDTIDSVVFLVVFDARRRPVLLAEIKDDSWVDRADLRFNADDQMRQRYDAMLADCPIPRLWGLELLFAFTLAMFIPGPCNLNSKTALATATHSPAFLRALGAWTFFLRKGSPRCRRFLGIF